MRRVDVERKRTSRWPWVFAVLILAALVWGITELLAPPDEEPGPEVEAAVSDTLPPVAVPAAGESSGGGVQTLPELMPLGPADAGRSVRFSGAVVATMNSGYWVAADSVVVGVQTDRHITTGDSVEVTGSFIPVEDDRGVRAAQAALADHPLYRSWPILVPVRVVPDSVLDAPQN